MELLELRLLIGWWSGFKPASSPVRSGKITVPRFKAIFSYKVPLLKLTFKPGGGSVTPSARTCNIIHIQN